MIYAQYKCVVANYCAGYKNSIRKLSFDFLENFKFTKKFNYFVSCQYWSLTKNCEIFIEQCDGEFIKLGKKCNLFGNLTQHSQQYIDLKSKSLLFTALDLARQSSKKPKQILTLFQSGKRIFNINY